MQPPAASLLPRRNRPSRCPNESAAEKAFGKAWHFIKAMRLAAGTRDVEALYNDALGPDANIDLNAEEKKLLTGEYHLNIARTQDLRGPGSEPLTTFPRLVRRGRGAAPNFRSVMQGAAFFIHEGKLCGITQRSSTEKPTIPRMKWIEPTYLPDWLFGFQASEVNRESHRDAGT